MRAWRWPRAFVPFHQSFEPTAEDGIDAMCLTPDGMSALTASSFEHNAATPFDNIASSQDNMQRRPFPVSNHATTHRSAIIRQWDIRTKKLMRTIDIEECKGSLIHLQVSPSGQYLLAALSNGEVLLWHFPRGDFIMGLWSKNTPKSTAQFIGDDQVAVLSAQMFVVVFRLRDGHVTHKTKLEGDLKIISMAISNDAGIAADE